MNTYVRTRVDRVRDVVDAVGEIVNPPSPPELCPNGETPHLRVLRNTA